MGLGASTPAAPAAAPANATNSRSFIQRVGNGISAAGKGVRNGVVGAATSVKNLVVPPKSTSEVPSVPASNPSVSKLPGAPMEQGQTRGGCWNMKRKRRTKKKSRKAKKSKRSNK
jgi:hypothetical protein